MMGVDAGAQRHMVACMQSETLHWQIRPSLFGPMLLAASEAGLCRLSFGEKAECLARLFPAAELIEDGAWAQAQAETVSAIVAGEMVPKAGAPLPLPLDLRGTDFQKSVWQALLDIEAGSTCSYGDLARRLGSAGADRAVGSANGANPICIIIPCHRVIRSDGALGGYAYGLDMKRALLRREGALPADLFG